jgi:hypothetical protein
VLNYLCNIEKEFIIQKSLSILLLYYTSCLIMIDIMCDLKKASLELKTAGKISQSGPFWQIHVNLRKNTLRFWMALSENLLLRWWGSSLPGLPGLPKFYQGVRILLFLLVRSPFKIAEPFNNFSIYPLGPPIMW